MFLMLLTGSFVFVNAQQTPAVDSLKEYTGKFRFPEGSEVTEVNVVVENGMLWAKSDKGDSELKKIEKDLFEVVSFTGTATFKRDDAGKVVGLHFEVGNLILDGKKDPEPAAGNRIIGLSR